MFNIGDIVKIRKGTTPLSDGASFREKIGIIVDVIATKNSYLVAFSSPVPKPEHSLNILLSIHGNELELVKKKESEEMNIDEIERIN